MSFSHRGRGNRDSDVGSVFCWSILCVRLLTGLCFLCLMCSLTNSLYAQEQQSPSGNPYGARNANTPDCTDPLLATSAECTGQSTEQNGSLLGSGMRTVPPGTLGTQSGNRSGYYSDTESLSRPSPSMNQTQPILPPEPLTEFQKFAASTTSQIVPIFGMDLFRHVQIGSGSC